MKKLVVLLSLFALFFSLCACGSTKTDTPVSSDSSAGGKATASQYEYTLNGDNSISDLIFENTVTVKGENGRIVFTNCEFKKDIVNNGGEGAKIMLDSTCVLSGNMIIESTLKEATQDTDLPKFMVFCSGAKASVGTCGSVVSSADLPITVNGHSYNIKDAVFFVNESTGEFGQYSGQEAQYHNVAMWNEGGSDIFMHVAVSSK